MDHQGKIGANEVIKLETPAIGGELSPDSPVFVA